MALLSSLIRSQAIYGSTDTIGRRVMGRQGGRWADQTVRAAMPHPAAARPAPPTAQRLQDVARLQSAGVLTAEEAAALRARLAG